MKKYELTEETVIADGGQKLHRIKALVSFVLDNGRAVGEGSLGGFIGKEENLSHHGTAWVDGNAQVFEEAMVSDNALVYNNAVVKGSAQLSGSVCISGNALVSGNVSLCSNNTLGGDTVLCDADNAGSGFESDCNAACCEKMPPAQSAIAKVLCELLGCNYQESSEVIRDALHPLHTNELFRAMPRLNPNEEETYLNSAIYKLGIPKRNTIHEEHYISIRYIQSGIRISKGMGMGSDPDDPLCEYFTCVKIVHFLFPERNIFNVADRWATAASGTASPFTTILLNGLPIGIVHLTEAAGKEPNDAEAFLQFKEYLIKEYPSLFVYNVFCLIGDISNFSLWHTNLDVNYSKWGEPPCNTAYGDEIGYVCIESPEYETLECCLKKLFKMENVLRMIHPGYMEYLYEIRSRRAAEEHD